MVKRLKVNKSLPKQIRPKNSSKNSSKNWYVLSIFRKYLMTDQIIRQKNRQKMHQKIVKKNRQKKLVKN